MKKRLKFVLSWLFVASFSTISWSQSLIAFEKSPIYRRSFTARYEIIGGGPVREAALSPDKTKVGFVRENDLYVKNLATGTEIRVTHDGERNKIINGATDWVYEEEYAFTRAWEWSPDSRRIAYLRFDESRVPEFTMMRYGEKLYPEPYTFKYPKAGEPNSVVTLHVCDIESGEAWQVATGYDTDQYIPRIGWTPGGELFFYRVNRLQNRFEVVLGNGQVIYAETSPTYVERPDDKTVTFLPDGDRFIVRQETRTGWMHLYLYSISDGFLNAITSGEWEVTELNGVGGDVVSYTSTEVSPLTRTDWTVKLNGKDKRRNTDQELWRRKNNLRPGDPRVFFTMTSNGVELNGWMLEPDGFDRESGKKYPVLMTQYSGPGSQSVSIRSLGTGDMEIYGPLLKAGYIIACVDGRGTGFRGEAFKKCTYGQLGKLETEDQIAAARWMAGLPYVDEERIGIYGWSFGGFIALNSILNGATAFGSIFKLAVAVAPVTSWRYYDTIYTEIYNGLPQDNPKGYDDNSPINYAHMLRGRLLLVHGTGDDNVHVQNSFEMAKALVKADKKFDMMIYPDDNHLMRPVGSAHVRRRIADYVIENL